MASSYSMFDRKTWTGDEWFQELPPLKKLLFIHLFSNEHQTPCGAFEITVKTISNETGLETGDIRKFLPEMDGHVTWFPEINYIFVHAFISQQVKGPKYAIGAKVVIEKLPACVRAVVIEKYPHMSGSNAEVIQFYKKEIDTVPESDNTLSIDYQYPIDTVSPKSGFSRKGIPPTDQIRTESDQNKKESEGSPNTLDVDSSSKGKSDAKTPNVSTPNVPRRIKKSALSALKSDAAQLAVALTGDTISFDRFAELWGRCDDAGRLDLWECVFTATKKKMESKTPPENAGAYFCGTLVKMMMAESIDVPTVGSAQERAEVEEYRKSRAGNLGKGVAREEDG